MFSMNLRLVPLLPAPEGRFFVGRPKEFSCQVEQARIRVEVLGGGAEPTREYTALLGELEACAPPCRFEVHLPVAHPALPAEQLHQIAYFFRREAGLLHLREPAPSIAIVNP